MFDSRPFIEALIAGDQAKLAGLTRTALDNGVAARQILNDGLITGMDIIGEKMENEDMFIPEVLLAAKAMSGILETLKPLLSEGDVRVAGKAVIGTVKGDLHDIGKNLVAMMLESSGFEVFNLGVDVTPEKFLAAAKENDADMLCLSALLTTTMPMMKKVIDAFVESGMRSRVKILVGGAPVTQKYAEEIGADGFAPDAGSAVKLAKSILQ
ncbi:MAG: corrinoid protein [Syntrophobacteraceae bacterium]|nr:corrinoid protein [Desulfobacteraceae bacterium]